MINRFERTPAEILRPKGADRKMFLITFINVPSHKEIAMTVYPPVGILSMSSCLKQSGNQVNFIDADIHRLNPKQVMELLKSSSTIDRNIT